MMVRDDSIIADLSRKSIPPEATIEMLRTLCYNGDAQHSSYVAFVAAVARFGGDRV